MKTSCEPPCYVLRETIDKVLHGVASVYAEAEQGKGVDAVLFDACHAGVCCCADVAIGGQQRDNRAAQGEAPVTEWLTGGIAELLYDHAQVLLHGGKRGLQFLLHLFS